MSKTRTQTLDDTYVFRGKIYGPPDGKKTITMEVPEDFPTTEELEARKRKAAARGGVTPLQLGKARGATDEAAAAKLADEAGIEDDQDEDEDESESGEPSDESLDEAMAGGTSEDDDEVAKSAKPAKAKGGAKKKALGRRK